MAKDIIQAIGLSINLKGFKNGNHIGLCPFHKEKTPSFVVSEKKNRFYCLGCGKAGDGDDYIRLMQESALSAQIKYLQLKAKNILNKKNKMGKNE